MKPNRNRFKRTSFGLILVWFGYFILKTKNYIVFLNFSNGFGSVFSGLVYFFDLIFQFQAYETKTEPNLIFF
jgi:hypothetical protein